jgi:hypothetical protein
MAFTGNFSTSTFTTGLPSGVFNFNTGTTQTFKIALYTNAATLNADTTTYTTTGEVVASGYTAGGLVLTISQVPTTGSSGTTAYWSFNNAVWTTAVTARGALIYLANGTTNPAICVLDFGSDKTSTNTFTVQFPSATNTTAIIRIATNVS